MEPILTDTLRFRLARIIAQRNAFREQRDLLANAIDDHRARHPEEAHEADSRLWNAYNGYTSVMRQEPDVAARRAAG